MATRLYSISELNPFNSGGTWTQTKASNLIELVKTPAADTTVVCFTLKRDLHGSGLNSSGVTKVSVHYVVATASLSSAPTVTVNKVVIDPSTRALSRTAVTNTVAFSGTNTVGTAAGTYTADIDVYNTYTLDEESAYTFEVSFVAATTTALKVGGVQVTYV